MKVFIVLATFVVVVSAGRASYGGAGYGAGVGAGYSSGTSSQFRQDDNYGNYNFGYDESHAYGGSSRREEQQNGVRRGSYSLTDADGRQRTVNYIADGYGFRATVHTNEPGVEPKDPADVLINKNGGAGYGAAPIAAAAPVAAAAYAAPAPIAAPVATAYAAPAPVAVRSYAAPRAVATYAAPAPVYNAAPVQAYNGAQGYGAQQVYEAPTPRAFSYSFGSSHPSYVAQAAPAYAAPAAPAYAAPAAPAYAAPAAPAYQENVAY